MADAKKDSFPSHCPDIGMVLNRYEAQEQAEQEAEKQKVVPTLKASAQGAAGSSALARFVGSFAHSWQALRDYSLSQGGHFAINAGALAMAGVVAAVSYGKFYSAEKVTRVEADGERTWAEKGPDGQDPRPELAQAAGGGGGRVASDGAVEAGPTGRSARVCAV